MPRGQRLRPALFSEVNACDPSRAVTRDANKGATADIAAMDPGWRRVGQLFGQISDDTCVA